MSPRLAITLLGSLLIIGGIVWFSYSENQSNQVQLEGSVLKVRTYPLSPEATLVFLDFRIENPTPIPFVVDSVDMELDTPDGKSLPGGVMTRHEIENFFQYEKLAGHEFNDPLIIQDKVPGKATWDRMAAARFEVPEAQVQGRKDLRLIVHEIDGRTAEIGEKAKQ